MITNLVSVLLTTSFVFRSTINRSLSGIGACETHPVSKNCNQSRSFEDYIFTIYNNNKFIHIRYNYREFFQEKEVYLLKDISVFVRRVAFRNCSQIPAVKVSYIRVSVKMGIFKFQ